VQILPRHSRLRPPLTPPIDRARRRAFGTARALGWLLLGLSSASGSGGEILMQMSGITGESTAYGHAGWMDVLAMSHGVEKADQSTKASHNSLAFTKRTDATSPLLYDRVNQGTVIPDVKIEFIRSSPPLIQFYQITLTSARIESVQDLAGAGSDMMESVLLAYEQISWSYTQVASPGMPATTATWNVATNIGTYSTNLTDTDLDGMPNAYELSVNLDPNFSDAGVDRDHDGLTNYQEFLAGTDPRNANSVFRVRRINLASGQVRITWNSVAGKTYTISAASQVNGPYTPVRNVASAGDGETFADFPPSPTRQFYRVSTP
jgi:type VI secretion system Hcp family effector